MDTLMRTQPKMLLGTWLEDAKRWGDTANDVSNLEFNARTQVTMWGNRQSAPLNDYAYKLWNGLIGDFYRRRWNYFVQQLGQTIGNPGQFNQTAFVENIITLEEVSA
jgi:alpha-N-acetylglucosaminidase